MPRRARVDAPGALHHVIIRGIERRAIFKGDADRDEFIDRLGNNLVASCTPCYAWALMPNHVHLLLRTGNVPLATLMRRLLTGYAMAFNRRHGRHGQLFQNRYKSILCQEETYLLELTRYIHLNPLRARLVPDIEGLDRYPYAGHAVLMGHRTVVWQDCEIILGLFDKRFSTARKRYHDFVNKAVDAGRRPELVGGGLVRSLGGWKAAKSATVGTQRMKGDERILGDSQFVLDVLAQTEEHFARSQRLTAKGIDLGKLTRYVADLFDLAPDQLVAAGRYPKVVQARSVLCYWAVRELGLTATSLARQMGLTQPAVTISVKRGEKIVKEMGLELEPLLK
ncbi:MAG: transposase [Desulfatitalea sp.]